MFKSLEYYKPNIDETVKWYQKMYHDALNHKNGHVSFRALPPSDVDYYEKMDLTIYSFPRDNKKYAEDLCRFLEKSFRLRKEVDDNFIPVITINLGIGDYSAFVNGDIVFQKDTSWSKPSLENLTDYKKFNELGTQMWYQNFLAITEEILKISAPSGIPFSRGFFSPLDLAYALRGDKIFYDFYDHPEELKEFLDYCAEATIKFANDIYQLAKKYLGNSKYGMFYLENIINMSEDTACLISGEQYQEFSAPYTQKVIDHFGLGHMHTHSRSLYLVKEISSLRNVVNLWLPTDPNAPKPIEHAASLAEDANGVHLAIDCESFAQIEENFQDLKKGNYSVTLPVKDIDEAIKLAKKFKEL